MTELADVAAALYGLPLEEFTATRDTRAKELRADGERALATAVKGLRRPSTAAWAVNQLVRARGDEVEQVLELGAALREAQATLAGDELRALSRQQHQLVGAVARQARAVARERGQRLSEGVVREVEATLKAAMAHVDAAAAVRSGLLLRALENTGFTSVDLDGAVALPDAIPAYGGRPQLRVVRDKDTDSGETDGETTADGATAAADGATAGRGPDDGADTGAGRGATRRTQGARTTKGARRRADDERAAEDEDRHAEEARRRAEEDERRRREEAGRAEERRREEAERAAERRRAREEAEAAAARADEERAAAQEALDEAERTVDDLAHRRGEVRERIADLRRRLDEAEREDDDVSTRLNDARSAREDAASALRAAARAADRARSRLEDLPDP